MNLTNLNPLFSASLQFNLHAAICLLSALAALSTWREYRRSPDSFLFYLSLSSCFLFLLSGIAVIAAIWRVEFSQGLYGSVKPLVSNFVKLLWVILFTYAFVSISPARLITQKYFLVMNVVLLVTLSTIICLFWLQFQFTALPGRDTFVYFWGDMLYESFILLLLFGEVYVALQVTLADKKLYLLAYFILIGREFIHISNILISHNTILLLSVTERILQVLFCCAILAAVQAGKRASANEAGRPPVSTENTLI